MSRADYQRFHYDAFDREKARARNDAYWRRHPERRQANNAVMVALRTGRLVRPDACGRCRCSCKPEAHHQDYSRPLDVEWLCRRCHRRADNERVTEPVTRPS